MLAKKILAVAVLGAFALPAVGFAEEAASPHTITGNLSFVSDYVFRGVSQTFSNPAVQGGFDYSHSSGIYLGTWGSNVSSTQYTNANMEWDFYGGYTSKITEDVGYNVGLIYVLYPDGETAPGASPSEKWDTAELYGSISWKWLTAKASYALTNFYGIGKDGFIPTHFDTGASSADDAANPGDSDGSIYLELNASYELPAKLMLNAHVGHQTIEGYEKLDYTDFKIGVSKEFSGFNFGLAYTDTDADDYTLFKLSDPKGGDEKLADGRLILSVTKTF
jgi:uncharacterized protein (TIGR02001 family)